MRRSVLICVSLLRSLLAATLFAAPITSGATLGSAAAAFAQTTDEPERASGNPYYGPGWSGPVNHAGPAACPAWYGSHTPCGDGSGGQTDSN
jgi:hypothetical protein